MKLLFILGLFSTSDCFAQRVDIDTQIAAVNAKASDAGLNVVLTKKCLIDWYQSRRLYTFQKSERPVFDQAFQSNILPAGFDFETQVFAGIPARIALIKDGNQFDVIADEKECNTWENFFGKELVENPPALDENEYFGTPLGNDQKGNFPASVAVRINQITLSLRSGTSVPTEVPGLSVEVALTSSNLSDLAHYFASGYDEAKTLAKLKILLGNASDQWIPIQQIFNGWASQWTNHFPAEKAIVDGASANDVCFGVSRQFFRDTLENGGLDRSTEATASLLKNNYRLLPDSVQPTFGDYLFLPSQHAIRMILRDPQSNRWIGITAWSSSNTPYRLWWIDQDYQGPTGLDVPTIDPQFPKRFDIWRHR